MKTPGIVSSTVLLALALGGCAGSAAPSATTAAAASTPSQAPTTSPVATEKQVAAIVAGGEKDWRDAYANGGKCRFASVVKQKGTVAEIERITCYAAEVTAGVEADTAVKELDALEIPPSMQALVTETRRALQFVVSANLETACGPAMKEPKDSAACSSALGTSYTAFGLLDDVLDKWAPYI